MCCSASKFVKWCRTVVLSLCSGFFCGNQLCTFSTYKQSLLYPCFFAGIRSLCISFPYYIFTLYSVHTVSYLDETAISVLESNLSLSIQYNNSLDTLTRSMVISTVVKDTDFPLTETNNSNALVINCNAVTPLASLFEQLLSSFQSIAIPALSSQPKGVIPAVQYTHCYTIELPTVILRYNIGIVNLYLYLNNVLATLIQSLESVSAF